MSFSTDFKKLNKLSRDKYINVYRLLGGKIFSECEIPTVGDIANIDKEQNLEKLQYITAFTGNWDDIEESIKRREANYTEEDSNKFMNSVIASNVTNITESGYFYKKLISSCDNMKITTKDCKSKGEKIKLPVTEEEYNYKIKFRNVVELDTATETYDEFKKETKDMEVIHIRTFLTCKADPHHRCFCKKCAGIFKRSQEDYFTPRNIGIYATYQITEKATQASLDSMNKGVTRSLNTLIEIKLDEKGFPDYESVKTKIKEIIDRIGYIGVMSRYYEIALLSRFYLNGNGVSFTPKALQSSFLAQNDKLGSFIYRPNEKNFLKLLSSKRIDASSIKSKIMFDIYEE